MEATYTESIDGFRSLREIYNGLLAFELLPPLPNGMPRYLFRAEQDGYPNSFTSMDRHFHNDGLPEGVHDELDMITSFIMLSPFLEKHLAAREAGAFAQHYGFPTQIYDFTSSAKVAMFFAANNPCKNATAIGGNMAILNVEKALQAGCCVIDDLRHHSYAKRSSMQSAFGMLYMGFNVDSFYCLKDLEIIERIGLIWVAFAHLEDDQAFLNEIGADADILSTVDDPFAGLAQELVDEYVILKGGLLEETAWILSRSVPAINRTEEENYLRWVR